MTTEQGSLLKNNARLESSESEFLRITRERYHAMVDRWSPKYDKRGRLAELGHEVPFTLEEFREWFLFRFNGNFHKLTVCEYCYSNVHVYDVEIDHRLPPDRGGSMDFNNLAIACASCNQQKGAMSDIAFMFLRQLVNDPEKFTAIDRDSVLGRLQRCLRQDKKVNSLNKQLSARNWKSLRRNPAGRIREPKP